MENNNIFKINDNIPKRITEKTLVYNNLTFVHYVLSNNDGIETQWKWL
jgi:hypothetical protein